MKYLQTFFKEKDLGYKLFEVEDQNGTVHLIDSETVIDIILNQTPREEQEQIGNVIRRIDFANGDVLHFLEHLAAGLVKNYTF